MPDAYYRRVALDYLKLFNSGLRRGILHELGRRYGRSPKTMRDHVNRARELGYRTKGEPGRA